MPRRSPPSRCGSAAPHACYRCGAAISVDPPGMRDTCERCHAWLHCCRNCEFYEPGAHNDCREPSAEPVADKEQGNFCDFFRFSSRPSRATEKPSEDVRARLDALFRKK